MLETEEQIATFRKMANEGCLDAMYWLASALLVYERSNDRGVEAAKWLFMAIYLGHEKSKPVLEFVNSSLGIELFNRAADEATEWLGEKFDVFQNGKDISKWSSELYALVKKGDIENKKRATIKLVINNINDKKSHEKP